MAMTNNYDPKNIASLELIYGKGYLSAGGDNEVSDLFHGINIQGKSVLDLGCGLGGAAVAMIQNLGANHVTGIDIDDNLLVRAEELVRLHRLESQISLMRVTPGSLPFNSSGFDLVYLTAVACHFEELDSLFAEIYRVLKPTGTLVGRDWIKIAENIQYRSWDNLLRERGLNFFFKKLSLFSGSIEAQGFCNIEFSDRTETMAMLAQEAVHLVNGSLKPSLLATLGEEGYRECVKWSCIRADALSEGGIGQFRFRASVPS